MKSIEDKFGYYYSILMFFGLLLVNLTLGYYGVKLLLDSEKTEDKITLIIPLFVIAFIIASLLCLIIKVIKDKEI